jgi:hypothetical protein
MCSEHWSLLGCFAELNGKQLKVLLDYMVKVKVDQSRYRPAVAQRVPGS